MTTTIGAADGMSSTNDKQQANSDDSNQNRLTAIGRQCLNMARRRAALAGLAAFVPIPGVDFVTDVAALLSILNEINERFGLSEAQLSKLSPARQAVAYRLVTTAGGLFASKLTQSSLVLAIIRRAGLMLGVMEATRFAPVVGQVIAAVIGYLTLTYFAKRHIRQCTELATELA